MIIKPKYPCISCGKSGVIDTEQGLMCNKCFEQQLKSNPVIDIGTKEGQEWLKRTMESQKKENAQGVTTGGH
ncbi:hypothetical protein LJC61_02690 [Ruminococcaceae bacterium OttesenSCG-928-A16]|nr:hypothetical protein [Ruminococcaceae bacterium OttesenSCG-928-A16]